MTGMAFNANEIFEMVIEAEHRGSQFYRQAADNAFDEKSRDILMKFAAMEDEHELIFKKMQGEFESVSPSETVFDPDGIGAAYLRAIADVMSWEGKVGPDDELTGAETLEDVLEIAIVAEKQAIGYYVGLKQLVKRQTDRDKVEAVICEEMLHLTQLSEMLGKIKEM